MDHGLKYKSSNSKTCKENIQDFDLDRDLLGHTQYESSNKGKSKDKLNFTNSESWSSKDCQKMKRQAMEQEKVFANIFLMKELYPEYIKNP